MAYLINDGSEIGPRNVDDIPVSPQVVKGIVERANAAWRAKEYRGSIATKLGDNFMSIVYSVIIDVESVEGDKDDSQLVSAIVKTMPKNAVRIASIRETQLFVKELKMYEEVLPSMVEFQTKCGISPEDIFSPWPQFYGGHVTESGPDSYIALQDLRTLNFGVASRREGFGLEDSKLVMEYLGKFHALSYSQFRGNFHKLQATYPFLEERMCRHPDKISQSSKEWMRELFEREVKMLRDRNPGEPALASAVENIHDSYWTEMHRLATFPAAVSVISHGDCWTSNLLLQYQRDPDPDTKVNKAHDLNFIDFQLCRVGSRCLDLGYFLYSSTQVEVLNEREEELLAEYFDAFKKMSTRLGHFDPKLTLEQLKHEYASNRFFGIALGLVLAPIVLAQEGNIPDLETVPEQHTQKLSEESKSIWFDHMEHDQNIYDKVINIVRHHIPKLTQFKK